MRSAGLIVLLLAAGLPAIAEELYPGYVWESVAEGVYLHRSVDPLASPVDGNSTVVDIGESLIVVDTHINPAVARAVVEKVRTTLKKPVTHIVNTHWHDDHVNGNYVWRGAYPDAKIFAHEATLEALRREWQPMEDARTEAYANIEAADVLAAADTLEDPMQAMGYRVYAGYVGALKPELPTLELTYPDIVFSDYLKLGAAELHWLGQGNTDGDIVVWLPERRVLITGDLLVSPVPFAFDSPMVEWADTLDRLREFGAETIVPGHGAAQDSHEYIDKVNALILATLDAVREAHDSGTTYDEISEAVDLSSQKDAFVSDSIDEQFAWQSYFVSPGLRSAWASLGFPVPESTDTNQ